MTDSLFDRDSWSREPKGWRLTLEDEEEVAGTNGVLKKSGEGTAIEWPRNARVLRLATRTREFAAASRFAERFEEYLKTSAKASAQEGAH